jgi:hypothetical protein
MYCTKLKCLYLLQEERFFFKVFFELHWALPYHALNSKFANFETPCIMKRASEKKSERLWNLKVKGRNRE